MRQAHWFRPCLLFLSLLLAAPFLLSCSDDDPTGPTTCTYTYSDWSACTAGTQTRSLISATPDGCTGTPGALQQSCSLPPGAPSFWGSAVRVEPCVFGIGLTAIGSYSVVVGFTQTGGSLPPGYSLVGNKIEGPPFIVDTDTSWSATFAALDNLGQQGPSSGLTLECRNNPFP